MVKEGFWTCTKIMVNADQIAIKTIFRLVLTSLLTDSLLRIFGGAGHV